MTKRKQGQHLLTGIGILGAVGLLLQPVSAAAQSNQRTGTVRNQAVVRNQGTARFDAAQRQASDRTVFGYAPAWNGSSGYGGYNQGYFYGGGSGYGQYSQSYFYGGNSTASSPDFDRDGTPDATDNDIDGDGVPNSRDRYDYNPRRS